MRYLFRFVCVCALGIVPVVGVGGCADGDDRQCNTADDCNDSNECTQGACDAASGTCSNTPVADGAICEAGACQSGSCEPIASVFPCTEQGIRDAIAAGGGPHAFDCVGATTVTIESYIDIDNDVILDGQGNLEVNGNRTHRVFTVLANVTAELRRLTVSGGAQSYFVGGGILNRGTATLVRCTVSGNMTEEMGGGGITNGDPGHDGELTIIDSTISGNTAPVAGGVSNWHGSMTVINTTVSGNTGGGLENDFWGTATVTNSTVSGNIGGWGGGVDNFGSLTLVHTTVSDNFTDFNVVVRGIANLSESPVTLVNSVVDGDCFGNINSNGYNIESPGNTCGFDEAKGDQFDVTEAQLNLGELADNGGSTMTHKPGDGGFGEGSVAIDTIPRDSCGVDEDQRGESRPGGTMCDVGSVEVQR